MEGTVSIPVWLAILMALLASLALLDRLLIPSVRWALRRRANRAIDELNTRLSLQIRPFKLTRRQVLIDQLLYDPAVLDAVEQHAKEFGMPREAAMDLAGRYAREIVPSFSAYFYFGVGTRLARRLSQLLYRVRIGYLNDTELRNISPDASVVFVINHRSNMDYVMVTYVAATASALSYAVGEWAQVWPLRGLIRSMGAYFIRRNSRDSLYRKVLGRYVHRATQAGVVQGVFPEGGLSLDGALRKPKLGLISYMVADFDPHGKKDIVFIPVGVNYDRVLEDRLLTQAGERSRSGGPSGFRVSGRKLLGFIANSIGLMLRGRWYRYGYACVSFGEPLSLREHLSKRQADLRTLGEEARENEIALLGARLMKRLERTVPALPVSLVSHVFLNDPGGVMTGFELKGRVQALIQHLESEGAYVHIPRHDREYAVEVGLRMLVLRHLIIKEHEQYRINPAEKTLLTYYANAIPDFASEPKPVAQAQPVATVDEELAVIPG